MKQLIFVITFCPLLFLAQPRAGVWRGVLKINAEEKMEIPFNFEVSSFNTIKPNSCAQRTRADFG